MSDSVPQLAAALAPLYRIERELGAGGMATVYLAEDLKHHRQVAVKVLRPELSAALGAERFLREIETTANLRHPHILPLYDSGEAGGFLYYVMPFVEGESLRDRLDRERQLPVDVAMQIAREVADALSYAHGRGVIHRDIKPENILLESGHAVVADFGIAKALSASGGDRLTATGFSVGTPRYMSPEQAAAEADVDARSDQYALACLLHEMLAGQPPFTGPTAESIVHQHLVTPPPLVTQLRPTVPADVATAMQRALAKTPADRYSGVAQFAEALQHAATSGAASTTRVPTSGRGRRPIAIGAGLAALAVIAGVLWRRGDGGDPVPVVARTVQITRESGLELDPAISPNGELVAYASGPVTRLQLFVRQVAGGRTVPLTSDSTRDNRWPRWSPDGTRIAYQSSDGVYVVAALGGSPRLVARVPQSAVRFGASFTPLVGLTWSPDGKQIAYAASAFGPPKVYVVNADGGEPHALDGPPDVHSPVWSPDGRHIAVVSGNFTFVYGSIYLGNVAPSSLWTIPVDGGAPVRVTDASSLNVSPQWTPDSRALLFVSDRGGSPDIFRVRVNSGGAPVGSAERITAGLNAHTITVSADGRHVAYAQLRSISNVWSLPMPRTAPVAADNIVPVTLGNQFIENLDVTRDGKWVVFASDLSGLTAIFKVPSGGGEPIQLTNDTVASFAPAWSVDGTRVAYHRVLRNGHRDTWVMNADGSDRQLRNTTLEQVLVPSWSPVGDTLLAQTSLTSNDAIAIFSSSGPTSMRRLPLDVGGDMVDWSPDGHDIVYHAADGIRAIKPTGGPSRLVASNAIDGTEAFACAWSIDGTSVYYLARGANGWMIREVPSTGGASKVLVQFKDPAHQPARYGFRTDGTRFFLTMGSQESDVWVIELAQR